MKSIFTILCMVSTWLLTLCDSQATFYTDNDLGQSVPIGKIEPRQQEKLQQELLELMGLYSKPKPKTINRSIKSAAKFMQDLYKSLNDIDGSDFATDDAHIHINSTINASVLGLDPAKVEGSDVIVSFVNNVKKAHIRHEKDKAFYFDFSEVSVGEQLKGAELRLYKEEAPVLKSGAFNVSIYAIKPGEDWEEKTLEYQSSVQVTYRQSGWIILDATRVAEFWTHNPHLNMGLYLKVSDSYGKELEPKDIGIVGHKGPADKQPFLVGYLDMINEVHSRRVRSLRTARWASGSDDDVSYADNPYTDYSRHSTNQYRADNNCQRHPLHINFRDIGFGSEFLIAPEGYSAFFCDGECSFPLGIHMNATNHAIVQTLVHLMTPNEAPKPCCAPTKFGTINLLYYDTKSSVILKKFKDMIVNACGCL